MIHSLLLPLGSCLLSSSLPHVEPVSTNSLPWTLLARHCSNVLPPLFATRAANSRASAYTLIRLIQVAVEGDFTFAIVQEKKE